MTISVIEDDLTSSKVHALILEHLAGMLSNSPPGHVNALAIEALRERSITFFSAWMGNELCGCGALKELSATAGEVKSMRTRSQFVRRGIGQAVLGKITAVAQERGYMSLYLETGRGSAFEAAHSLYLRNGFQWTQAFGDYVATDFNAFMVKSLKETSWPYWPWQLSSGASEH